MNDPIIEILKQTNNELQQDKKDLQEENRILKMKVLALDKKTNLSLQKLTTEDLNWTATLGGEFIQVWAEHMIADFQKTGAKNYYSVRITDQRNGDNYEFLMQKTQGETPAEQNQRLRKEVADLEQRVTDLQNGNARS